MGGWSQDFYPRKVARQIFYPRNLPTDFYPPENYPQKDVCKLLPRATFRGQLSVGNCPTGKFHDGNYQAGKNPADNLSSTSKLALLDNYKIDGNLCM